MPTHRDLPPEESQTEHKEQGAWKKLYAERKWEIIAIAVIILIVVFVAFQ